MRHQPRMSPNPLLTKPGSVPEYLVDLPLTGPECDTQRLARAWARYQRCRDRNAIYDLLDNVLRVCARWNLAMSATADAASQLSYFADPVAEIMRSASGQQLDRRTAAKWSRALRFALARKPAEEPLEAFVLRHGGINNCALARRKESGQRR